MRLTHIKLKRQPGMTFFAATNILFYIAREMNVVYSTGSIQPMPKSSPYILRVRVYPEGHFGTRRVYDKD